MTASLGSCIRALMPLMSAMSFCPPSLPKPLSLIPSYGGIRFEHTHLGVGGTNIHPRVATKRLPVSINSFTTCVFIVLYMLLFPILYRLLTGALTSNLKLSWGHVLCDRQNYSRKKWVPDPDPDGGHKCQVATQRSVTHCLGNQPGQVENRLQARR